MPGGVIHITQGVSLDHPPDLNQVILQLISEYEAGIPFEGIPIASNSKGRPGLLQIYDTPWLRRCCYRE